MLLSLMNFAPRLVTAGSKRFKAIFIGYEDHRIGWHVRDLQGKYFFSNNIIFNESSSGRLGVPRPVPAPSAQPNSSPALNWPVHKQPHVHTSLG